MKSLSVALVTGAALLSVSAADVLTDLGVSEGRAREAVFDSFASGAVSLVGNVQVFTSASPEARAGMVKTVTTLARAFAESDDFMRRYADHREANAPDPLPQERTADEVLAKQRSDYEAQVTSMQAQFDQITPQQRAVLERGFDEMRARFDAMENDGTKAKLNELLRAQRALDVAAYEDRMKDYERAFPKDPRTLIAQRLRRFLAVSSEIDYSARLVERDGKLRFADPALEGRPAEWKMCFRAGREATEAARLAAQLWLSAIETKALN